MESQNEIYNNLIHGFNNASIKLIRAIGSGMLDSIDDEQQLGTAFRFEVDGKSYVVEVRMFEDE